MALEFLAVEGMTVDIAESSDPTLSAIITIVSLPTNDIFADGKKVFLDQCIISGSTFSGAGGTATGPIVGNLIATTSINFNKTFPLLRENDKTAGLSVTLMSGGSPTVVNFKYAVINANQTVCEGK